MDVDWCLSCDRRLDGLTTASGPYCSPECLSFAQPASRLAAPVATPAPNTHRIHQWAAAIPPHVPAGAPSCPFAEVSASASTQSTRRSPSPRARFQATPKLIERTSATAPVPTLCVSSPAQVRPLPPTRSTHCAYFNGNTASNTTASMSEASTSLTSLLSEPLVATPDEGDSPFGIGAFVRSWVHRDREHAKSTNEEVVEEIKSYFPPYLSSKTSPPRQKKSKIIQSPPPAPIIRQKFAVMKATHFNDRDRSTPTDSHTPTPVVFPSCRAAEFDLDDDDDDESFVPQAHYHHHFQQKYEPQTRSPSLSPSNSSSGSSILLMAPKRVDARGRRGGRVIAP
ncbi:hypothetical protein DEU56DRAFT_796322 [Suillus clintonianus]|uniref:uncharacterized protein n=1 Tax=Suillus clintonianus TaxID=1904413 RepID=UPI001B87DFA2|nr:uncharacterized protein DEU56DRAFT_796322 [Suillus clintonianus]KAG2141337.1 hypothetical protein DEU56DRAFT_796322 [Suillus clintonianus]